MRWPSTCRLGYSRGPWCGSGTGSHWSGRRWCQNLGDWGWNIETGVRDAWRTCLLRTYRPGPITKGWGCRASGRRCSCGVTQCGSDVRWIHGGYGLRSRNSRHRTARNILHSRCGSCASSFEIELCRSCGTFGLRRPEFQRTSLPTRNRLRRRRRGASQRGASAVP